MRLLILDIETSPHKVFTWGLWRQNIALNQIAEVGSTLCWSAKWHGEKKMHYADIREGKESMLRKIYDLVEEADVVVHYNGSSFDMPTLNKEWLSMGWTPPAPYQQVDLFQTVKKKFRLPSNKLSYISEFLKIGEKVNHKGMELWLGCMNGNEEDWAVMTQYNKQDVNLLEKLYDILLPWVSGHPNHALFVEGLEPVCPNCGSVHVQWRGYHYTKTQTYKRLACFDCGSWSRFRTSDIGKEKRKAILASL